MIRFILKIEVGILSTLIMASCSAKVNKVEVIENPENAVHIIESVFLDSVWAANKVSFALHTVGNDQYAAYYNKDRMMTVAKRKINSLSWQKTTLPNQLKWDSHNYVAMGIDEQGYIHISGNMHVDSLVYFRSQKPHDITIMIEINEMTGIDESDVTYPKFFYNDRNQLFFSYRSGSCGNGNILINQFEAGSWKRYLTKPLFEGVKKEDKRAAYHKFVKDDGGNFHFIWMWRWTPEVATSHQICYASSSDLIQWKNAAGEEVLLPFTPDDQQLIVDPSPSHGGMHNSKYELILTAAAKPLVAYLKYDEQGFTQLYLAKFENDNWVREKISDWNFRWKFFGGGDKMSSGASFKLLGFTEGGSLMISWDTETGKSGHYLIDPSTMKHVDFTIKDPVISANTIAEKMTNNQSLFTALQKDSGAASKKDEHYLLKWEAMKKSHGRHAPAIIPDGPLSPLVVLKTKKTQTTKS